MDQTCIGFGKHEGKCKFPRVERKVSHIPTEKTTGYLCERCEKLRHKYISKEIARMLRELDEIIEMGAKS